MNKEQDPLPIVKKEMLLIAPELAFGSYGFTTGVVLTGDSFTQGSEGSVQQVLEGTRNVAFPHLGTAIGAAYEMGLPAPVIIATLVLFGGALVMDSFRRVSRVHRLRSRP